MRTLILSFLMAFGLGQIALAASTEKNLIELGVIYHQYKDAETPGEEVYNKIKPMLETELKFVASFIRDAITPNSNMLTTEYLRLPNDKVLEYFYTIRQVDWNMSRPKPKANADILVDLSLKKIDHIEMVDTYYDILFNAVGAKNEHVDLASINFVLGNYGLSTETEKSIFFFKTMDLCSRKILMEASKIDPTDQALALTYFDKFPLFNGLNYYYFDAFGFEPFKLKIAADRTDDNYKAYYLNRYYDVLLWHAECLNSKKKFKEQRADLILNSVLSKQDLYVFSANRNMVEKVVNTME